MKKLFATILLVAGTVLAWADNYPYLTFETTEGAKVSVSSSSLTLTISGTTLTAGSRSFTLSNLKKMYFSSTDETTGIQTPAIEDWNEAVDIYDLQGHKVAKNQTRKGAYIIKTKKGTYKIVVK